MSEEFEAPLLPLEEPRTRSSVLAAILIVAVVVLLCCCCAAMGTVWFFYTYGDQLFGLTIEVLLQLTV